MEATAVKRPWQGTFLGVLNVIGLVLLGLLSIALIVILIGGGAALTQMMEQSAEIAAFPMASMFTTMGAILLIPVLAIFVLGVFITMGIFKGQKWAIIVSIIFTALSLLSSFANMDSIQWFGLALTAFVLYLEIMCVKNPFYNR
jgi:hypothetical protein